MTIHTLGNKRMAQILRHAGVRVIATAGHRTVIGHIDEPSTPMDPLYRLIAHLEPNAVHGNEHMPSLEEARALGLIEEP